MDPTGFDPSLPGIRLLQTWMDGRRLDGRLVWQDPHYFALHRDDSVDPVLINRQTVLTVRPLV